MYIVGLIGDDIDFMEDCSVRLRRKGIVTNNLKCVIVNYKLTQAYPLSGAELVAYINSKFPDLPCILLNDFVEEGIDENWVVDKGVLTKDLDDSEFEAFVSKLKQSAEVFENRLKCIRRHD